MPVESVASREPSEETSTGGTLRPEVAEYIASHIDAPSSLSPVEHMLNLICIKRNNCLPGEWCPGVRADIGELATLLRRTDETIGKALAHLAQPVEYEHVSTLREKEGEIQVFFGDGYVFREKKVIRDIELDHPITHWYWRPGRDPYLDGVEGMKRVPYPDKPPKQVCYICYGKLKLMSKHTYKEYICEECLQPNPMWEHDPPEDQRTFRRDGDNHWHMGDPENDDDPDTAELAAKLLAGQPLLVTASEGEPGWRCDHCKARHWVVVAGFWMCGDCEKLASKGMPFFDPSAPKPCVDCGQLLSHGEPGETFLVPFHSPEDGKARCADCHFRHVLQHPTPGIPEPYPGEMDDGP